MNQLEPLTSFGQSWPQYINEVYRSVRLPHGGKQRDDPCSTRRVSMAQQLCAQDSIKVIRLHGEKLHCAVHESISLIVAHTNLVAIRCYCV
jgi:hypothetical protein